MVPTPTPYGLPFLKIGGLQLSYPSLSQERATADFKFGRYIYRDNLNKSLLKILEKRERGRIQGVPKFFVTPYYLRKDKATDFKFCRNIHIGSIRTKAHEKCWE